MGDGVWFGVQRELWFIEDSKCLRLLKLMMILINYACNSRGALKKERVKVSVGGRSKVYVLQGDPSRVCRDRTPCC